ncbi:MAG: MoaD/ThiS family protein [Candidatus Thorarchaeota archaeon]
MLTAKIVFLSLLTDITQVDEVSLNLDDGSIIRTVLEQLSSRFGDKFEEMIYKNSKDLSKYVLITINGEDIRSLNGLETKIQQNDEISFIPAIAGG